MRRPKLYLLSLLAAVLAASVAVAATPSSGTVSKDSPTVEWTGLLAESFLAFNVIANSPEAPCVPPGCDTFALQVADGGANLELAINLDSTADDGSAATAGMRIASPDGSSEFVSGPSDPDKAFKHTIKKAAAGAYTIDVVNTFVGAPGGYTGRATLLIPGAATTPTTPAPPPSQGQNPAAQQQPAPLPKLTAKVGKASAKKLAKSRKLSVKLTTTAPLTKLAAVLRKGSKSAGKGKLAKLDSKGTLVVKLPKKKLKTGTYKLTVQGLDSQNRTVTATATVKVSK